MFERDSFLLIFVDVMTPNDFLDCDSPRNIAYSDC